MSPPAEAGIDAEIKMENPLDAKSALTPPTSEGTNKKEEDSDSELSDLEPEQIEEPPDVPKVKPEEKVEAKVEEEVEDDGEIFPDHYYDGGNVPVFKPVSRYDRQRTNSANSMN